MNELQVTYTVVARTKDRRTLRVRGLTGMMLPGPGALGETFGTLLLSALDGFISGELDGNVSELANLSRLTVRFQDIEVEVL